MAAWLMHIAICLIVTASTCVSCWSAERTPQIYPMPITEMGHLVSDWLTGSGLQVDQKTTEQGKVLMQGTDSQGRWEISLEPRSALSTAVSARYRNNGTVSRTTPDLYEYLQQYPKNRATENPIEGEEIPPAVQAQVATSVCLYSAGQGESVEFSGGFIDRGLILTTAHGLQKDQKISVVLSTGAEYQGDILKLDPERDLALIKIGVEHASTIALDTGRNLLGKNEKVYSIGCPVNARGTVNSGVINDQPRRVGQHPFWQVAMIIQPGSSGSPVFDGNGALVAIIKGRYRGTGTTGFLIPLETIMDFLNEYFAQCNTDATK